MHSVARKLHVIEEVLKVEDEALLIEVEALLENRNSKGSSTKGKPSDYAGCISTETAKQLLQQIEESRNEWERDI